MRAIDIKLWRELWQMRLQALAIAMVIISGVSIFIMSLSTYDSLKETRDSYYRTHQFADIFASLKRAPVSLEPRIKAIPGVETVETRVVTYVNIDVPGFSDPVSGHMISLPEHSVRQLNQLFLRQGRLVDATRDNEIVLSEEFAKAHQLQLGDTIRAIINGRRQTLTIVGLGMSPEYIYQIAPGAMFPDYQRYGVMWVARKPLASAYDMEGAFNHVTLKLNRDTHPQAVITQLDTLLKPYGGTGAIARKDQLSHRFLDEELKQLQNMATLFPIIFFAVAAFLLNVVVSRLISLQREQIAILKAFGYSNLAVGIHYSKLILMIVAFGIVIGTVLGVWMGTSMSNLYRQFYSLPYLVYELKPWVLVSAGLISMGVAILGTLYAVQKAIRLPPAEGMRPEQPATYHPTLVERLGLQKFFSQPTRMILRHLERRPLKSALTTLGISMAFGIMMVGGFQEGAINYMIEVQYKLSQREDMMALFAEPRSKEALYSLKSIPGIEHAEGIRMVNANLKYEHRSYRTGLQGIDPNSELKRLLDADLKPIHIPEKGVILTDYLAERLHLKLNDSLTVEILEGKRPTLHIPVVGIVKEYLGLNAYMHRDTLNQLLQEGNVISGALLAVDSRFQQDIYAELKNMPMVVGVVEQRASIAGFNETMEETILFFTFITTLLGGSIAFGVVYNNMRIALSERHHELASLRVLGFRRSEVAYILLGEMAVLTLLAVPVGFLVGYGFCAYLAFNFDSDLYRIPLILSTDVYAFSALVVIVSSLISGSLIWRNLAHLDMVAVLKSKE